MRYISMKKLHLTIITSFLFLMGCSKSEQEIITPTCDTTQIISFSSTVQPIITKSCNIPGCHVSGFANGDFTNYDGIKERVDNGSMKTRTANQSMPLEGELTIPEIETILCWIESGAANN